MTEDEMRERLGSLQDQLATELETLAWSEQSMGRFMEFMATIRSEEYGAELIDMAMWVIATLTIQATTPTPSISASDIR